ncbi:hypothetical protein BC629DRAFT_1592266 [Irpex lacteus]|nr:hypothetical protein BC629DRAFT_1592266 [Irpex lacteus]
MSTQSNAPNVLTTDIGNTHQGSLAGSQHAANDDLRGILCLHDELLAEISVQFMLLHTRINQPHDFRPLLPVSHNKWIPKPTSPYEWITISHVSRRWRAVALTTRRLWTMIALPYNRTWIKMLLERSGQMPLTVIEDIAQETRARRIAKELVLRETHRIKHLALALDTLTAKTIITRLTSSDSSASLLEALEIKLVDDAQYPAARIPLPSHNSLPRIRHLAFDHGLSDTPNEWTGESDLALIRPLFRPSLTSLYIRRLETAVYPETILDILRVLPGLEDVKLGEVFMTPAETPARQLRFDPVHLRHLRNIEFRGTDDWYGEDGLVLDPYDTGVAAANVLQHLVIPTSTKIFLSAGATHFSEEPLEFICDVLADALEGRSIASIGPQRRPINNCHLKISGADLAEAFSCEYVLSSPARPASGSDPSGGPVDSGYLCGAASVPLTGDIRTNNSSFTPCVCRILKSFSDSLSHVTTLHLYGRIENIHSDDVEGYIDDLWRIRKHAKSV